MPDREKIELCLHEILMVKEILQTKQADDFTARVLAIYATMRVDDLVKFYSEDETDTLSTYKKDFSSAYHTQFNQLRDKFGAHFQHVEDGADMLNRVQIFRNFSCDEIFQLIDDALILFQLLFEQNFVKGFTSDKDLQNVGTILNRLYCDDQAVLTIGSLDIFGINKGGCVTFNKSQQKVQHLKTLEVIESIAYSLLNYSYTDYSVQLMFRRLYICSVINFYDNLVSRKDVSARTNRGELGLDSMYKTLYTQKDDTENLNTVFERFESKHHLNSYFKSLRQMRNKCCGHFAKDLSVKEINDFVMSVDIDELKANYTKSLDFLNYLTNNIFLLKICSIEPRIPLFNVSLDTSENIVDFYGNHVEQKIPQKEALTPLLAWHNVRKGEERAQEAEEFITQKLFDKDETVYCGMLSVLLNRLLSPCVTSSELSKISLLLISAKRGYPDRLQEALLSILPKSVGCAQDCILYVISHVAVKDKEGNIIGLINELKTHGNYIRSVYAALIAMRIDVCHSYRTGIIDNTIMDEVKTTTEAVKHPIEHLALVISMCNHWFEDSDFTRFHKTKATYSEYLENKVFFAIENHCTYIRSDKTFCEKLLGIAKAHRFIQLLFECGINESQRHQKTNIFWNIVKNNCVILNINDKHESMFGAIIYEQIGLIDRARQIFISLLHQYPLSDDVQKTYESFCSRNPEQN